MKALPTLYNGVQYRSLLEARWAAFFALVGIQVQYEAEAFAGYIPDFLYKDRVHLRGDVFATRGTVEDDSEFGQYCESLYYSDVMVWEVKGSLEQRNLKKIRASGFGGAVLVFDSTGPSGVFIDGGCLYQADEGGGSSFASFSEWVECFYNLPLDQQEDAWKEAGNLVQWRSPRRAL